MALQSRRRQDQYDVDGDPVHYPTRPVDREKAETELTQNIKKATSPEETAPKQKHVRKCIVYTWDYHTSMSIWTGLRVQPILADEVQTFKALIVVHKVLQEGHPITLKEAQSQTGWLETCARTVGHEGARGYGPLIRTYVSFILAKLRFHRIRPEFNGLFEYEEYVTLKGIDDPNEGYETISDLMGLQDQIESFQRMVFAHFRHSANNECRISSLVPLVKESWGIYRFITSMLRAMHRRTDDLDALEPLRQRFKTQHYSLRKFYYECSNLKYLTGLINVPKLGQEPPDLLNNGDVPDLPPRPESKNRSTPPPVSQTPDVDIEQQARIIEEYEAQQRALVSKMEAEEKARLERQLAQQREFEERQRLQAENERQQAEALQMQQMSLQNNQAVIRVNELERDMLTLRGQYERDQLLLQQYDMKVKSLETELTSLSANMGSQVIGKDEIIRQLQEQVTHWRNKYESLAKLYTQLRTEHLELLSKSKQIQLKANSAQEAVDKMERMERDIKTKNLELADMIRERDRARFDIDRAKSNHKDEIDRLKRELRFANERADDAGRNKSAEVSGLLNKYNRQLNELEDSLRAKQIQIDDLLRKLEDGGGDLERIRDEKDQEIQILQEGLDSALHQLSEQQSAQSLTDQATNAQIDTLLLDNRKKLNQIIDSIFQACVQKIDDAIYELELPGQAGNLNSTPEYTLSMIEKAQNSVGDFTTVFCLFAGGEPGGEHVEVIKTANEFAQTIADVLINVKGLTRLSENDDASDKVANTAKGAGDSALRAFLNLQSYKSPTQQSALRSATDVRASLSTLSDIIDKVIPKAASGMGRTKGDAGDIVEQEMLGAAKAIEAATQRIQLLMAQARDSSKYSKLDLHVHDSILSAALAITQAIARLIQASIESQQEIVNQGKGSSTSQQFYKKNNRWTEGLISAAKAVAFATNILIESADGVLSGTHSPEQLIVASNEVAAATAQLVAASRVKASLMSKTQDRLELAAKGVTEACKALVKQVKALVLQESSLEELDYKNMAVMEFKRREMEQQVEILKLEKELGAARHRLGAMRRAGYHTDETN